MKARILNLVDQPPAFFSHLIEWISTQSSISFSFISDELSNSILSYNKVHLVPISGSKARCLSDMVTQMILRGFEYSGRKSHKFKYHSLLDLDLFLDNGQGLVFLDNSCNQLVYVFEYAEKILMDDDKISLFDFVSFIELTAQRLNSSRHVFKVIFTGDFNAFKARSNFIIFKTWKEHLKEKRFSID
jgi:hypothetical protein